MSRARNEDLREKLVERNVLHEGNYISLYHDVVLAGDGELRQREVVMHPGAVAMLALLDDGRLLLVRQYRHAATELILEIPAGTLDRASDGSLEDPAIAAARELAEETGYRAVNWQRLASFFTAPGFASEQMHLYLATGLEQLPGYGGPAADERLELEVVPWREALAMAERGDIHDAKTLIGILWLARLAESGEVAELRAS